MRSQRIAAHARADIRGILSASRRAFGVRAKQDYKALIDRAIMLVCKKPDRAGVHRHDDLPGAPFVFHLRHALQRNTRPKLSRHLIVFTYDDATVTILRVLHDAMDLPQHVEGDE